MKFRLFSLLLAVLLLTGCAQNATEDNKDNNTAAVSQTQVAGNSSAENADQEPAQEPYILTFEATTIDGEELTSERFSDSKLTMLNVWATYCNPCISEMPDLGEIATEYDAADFQLIGIISDVIEGDDSDLVSEAEALITQTNANYPHLLLNQSLYSNLVGAVSAVPTTFFINQEGVLLGYVEGAKSKDIWVSIIDELLAEME